MGLKNWLEEIGFPLLDRKAVAGLILFWILVFTVGGCLLIGMAQRLSPEPADQTGVPPVTLTQTHTLVLPGTDTDATPGPSPTPNLLPGELTSLPLTQTAAQPDFFPTFTRQVFTPQPTQISTMTRQPTATWNIYIFTRVVSTSIYRSSTPRPVATTHIPTTAVSITRTPTSTMTPTATQTSINTVTPPQTVTPTLTATQTATVTETVTPTSTDTQIFTPTVTSTETETPTPTATETETPTPTATDTETPTPTVTLVSTVISFSADFMDADTAQDNTLDLVSVDEDGGNLQKILANNENMLIGDWSPDGAKIVFEIHQNTGTKRLYTANANGSAKTLIANQPEGVNSEPQWSPDGEWIVHVNRNPDQSGGAANIWVIPAGGGAPVALTSGTHQDTQPSWSPDGNSIVFVRNTEIYKLDVNELYSEPETPPQELLRSFLRLFSSNAITATEITTVPQPLFNGSPTVLGDWPRYSPDGKYLAFVRQGSLIRMTLSTKVELNLTNGMPTGTARTPSWSPDGRLIAFIFHTNGEIARDEIWLVSSTGEDREKLELTVELVEKHRPIWKP